MADRDALLRQLDGLTGQQEQLAALVGNDTQSPLIPLQVGVGVALFVPILLCLQGLQLRDGKQL